MANPQEVDKAINVGTNRKTFNASLNPIRARNRAVITLIFLDKETTTSSITASQAKQSTTQPPTTPMDINQIATAQSLQGSLDAFCAKMKAANNAALAKIKQGMQQQIDAQIKTIIKDICESILASIQDILDESLDKLSAST
eukprot:5646739-Ditylum_brightwellii.AAC.1